MVCWKYECSASDVVACQVEQIVVCFLTYLHSTILGRNFFGGSCIRLRRRCFYLIFSEGYHFDSTRLHETLKLFDTYSFASCTWIAAQNSEPRIKRVTADLIGFKGEVHWKGFSQNAFDIIIAQFDQMH